MSDDNSLYNADELIAPDWLNKEFFEEILKKSIPKPSLMVTKLTITPGTTKSDHYGSVMFRAQVHYIFKSTGDKNMQSFIIKTAPTIEGEKKDLLENFVIFETEISMYTESLPKIESILRKHGDDTKLCAKIYYHSLEKHKCLVFEDLVQLGYTTISQRCANMDEAKVAFLKLAKMHAISFKLAQEGDKAITAYNDGVFSNDKIFQMNFVKESLPAFKENINKYDDLRPYISEIEKIESNLFNRIIESFTAYQNGKRDGIFVLCHGDFHIKNMMIKEKNDKLEDLMLVDFQICVFTSPAIDVLYAFVMLFSADMRLKHRDELFYYYFTNFQETLRKIGFQGRIPTMIDFQKELLNHIHWEFFLMISFLLFNYIFCDDGDLGKSIEDKDYRLKIWQNADLIKELTTLLPKLMYRGAFEE